MIADNRDRYSYFEPWTLILKYFVYFVSMKGNFDAEAAQDSNKMEKLFLLSQMIMRIKATEASIASEEIERMAGRYQGRNVDCVGNKWTVLKVLISQFFFDFRVEDEKLVSTLCLLNNFLDS